MFKYDKQKPGLLLGHVQEVLSTKHCWAGYYIIHIDKTKKVSTKTEGSLSDAICSLMI